WRSYLFSFGIPQGYSKSIASAPLGGQSFLPLLLHLSLGVRYYPSIDTTGHCPRSVSSSRLSFLPNFAVQIRHWELGVLPKASGFFRALHCGDGVGIRNWG